MEPKKVDASDNESKLQRVRVTANLPHELHARIMDAKETDESLSEAICKILQMGLLSNAAIKSSSLLQKNQKTFENIALVFMREAKEIREIVSSLKNEKS